MKKTFKMVAVVLTVVLSIGLFAGCGNKTTDKNEQGQTMVSVGNWPTKEGTELENMESRKERFEAANKDAVIIPDSWTFDRKTFYAKAAGEQLPTAYLAGFTEMPEIISSGYSADISGALKKHGYDGMFNDAVLEVVSDGDKILAFPTAAYILGLAYNTELFEKAGLMETDGTPKQPKNWDEVVEFAVKIKETTGEAGIVFPTSNRSGGWIFTSIAWSFGVDFMEKDADGKWKATFNTPEAEAALQWYKDLKWKYDIIPSNTLIDGAEWYKTFGTGAAGMTIAAGDYPGRVLKYGMTPNQVGMMVVPAGPKRHVTLLGGDVQAINPKATDDQIDAAIRWFEIGHSFELTDDFKQTIIERTEKQLADNQHVGIKSMSVWSDAAPSLAWQNQYIDEKSNANPNHVRLYNECVENCKIEIQPEEPVACQELYTILDGCIQEVLTNKDADVKAILEKANSDFQMNYLNNL